MKFSAVIIWAALSCGALSQNCQADKCFPILKLNPPLAKIATTVCQKLLRSTPPATAYKTVTSTAVTTITPNAPTYTATTIATVTITSATVCTTTTTQPQSLTTSYGFTQQHVIKKRQDAAFLAMGAGCTDKPAALTAKISKACSCFLTPTATRTVTITSTSTSVKGAPAASTATFTTVSVVTTQTCTTTTTSTVQGGGGPLSCGMAVSTYTSGSITCANTAAAPSATNARFRIEGNDSEGTLFEGCIASGPADITTPSGGTHPCDGTNNGANPTTGGTLTTQINAAAAAFDFDFDGTYSAAFQDFFITRIGQSAQTSTQFWGVLLNEQFTPAGGCQSQFRNGDRGLWAFDAFSANYFLVVSPDYAAVAPGSPVSVTIRDGQTGGAISGAQLSDKGTSDTNGNVAFTAPTERGCYVLKATRAGAIRSNAFYLSVF